MKRLTYLTLVLAMFVTSGCELLGPDLDDVKLEVEVGEFAFGDTIKVTLENRSKRTIGYYCNGLLGQRKVDGKWTKLENWPHPLLDCIAAGPFDLAPGDTAEFRWWKLAPGEYRIGTTVVVRGYSRIVLSAPFDVAD